MLKPVKNNRQSFSKITKGLKIAIIRSEFNPLITKNLEQYCLKTLKQQGVKRGNITAFLVPGALEIPIAAKLLAKSKRYHAIIALGAIIKGDTYHFELVANECARGCMDIVLEYEVPVIFEVLATYTLEQAQIRSSNNKNNKGIEAAVAALKICTTLSKIKEAK